MERTSSSKVCSCFSSGEIKSRPDFAGYAIGDTTLENYTEAKLAVYFKKDGGRIKEGARRSVQRRFTRNYQQPRQTHFQYSGMIATSMKYSSLERGHHQPKPNSAYMIPCQTA